MLPFFAGKKVSLSRAIHSSTALHLSYEWLRRIPRIACIPGSAQRNAHRRVKPASSARRPAHSWSRRRARVEVRARSLLERSAHRGRPPGHRTRVARPALAIAIFRRHYAHLLERLFVLRSRARHPGRRRRHAQAIRRRTGITFAPLCHGSQQPRADSHGDDSHGDDQVVRHELSLFGSRVVKRAHVRGRSE